MKTLKKIDVDKVARAIENDSSHPLPGLRESLRQAKSHLFSNIHTPEQIAKRRLSVANEERAQDGKS